MNDHGVTQFKPNTTVAAIVHHQGKFLLVEEWENGNTVFNQPAGHLETNENLVAAANRELQEETGLTGEPAYASGIYYFHRPELNLYFLRFCFVYELSNLALINSDKEDSKWPICQPQDSEIIACHWLRLEEIKAKANQLRSPMVLECIEDYLAGNKISLSMLKTNL
ncbi:NUDIX hydrolase [Thalassotalea euphylliae]|uniref:Phosphatase NudJ n=1 Tax=Thalassotalea euphylliae TaxID=1655234 RepID=A0A3E0UFW3_9GAMM|nr:NUDIX hydrolase [Thalassotalea euphylliae]REL35493.1 NUDIX hydrolase [Thalassotalea euphylliae]